MFKRSFYPDGNQTRDQVIFFNEEGIPAGAHVLPNCGISSTRGCDAACVGVREEQGR